MFKKEYFFFSYLFKTLQSNVKIYTTIENQRKLGKKRGDLDKASFIKEVMLKEMKGQNQ